MLNSQTRYLSDIEQNSSGDGGARRCSVTVLKKRESGPRRGVALERRLPVIEDRRLHGQQQERHDGVADGQLRGSPGDDVIRQLDRARVQEAVAEIPADLPTATQSRSEHAEIHKTLASAKKQT